MAEIIRSISWEAPEHRHIEKSSDWYWVLGILAVAAAAVSIILGNLLFGIVILLAAATMALIGKRPPKIIVFEISQRGVRVGQNFYPFGTLESYYIDEECFDGPQLLIKSQRVFVPLIIAPIPEIYINDIDSLLAPKLTEEFLEEPFSHRLLEFFGF